MIASFFRRLEGEAVDYLLISGQATILYGAATFSEDVDLWLSPAAANLERFISVLRSCAARYYKLTPPLALENLQRGHGFHFVLPGDASGSEFYLDVMGKPPRVGGFEQAATGARYFDTDFGRVHTVGIKELVEIKKTQRPADYPIIGRLALAHLNDVSATEGDLLWALENTFGLPELRTLFAEHRSLLESALPVLSEPFDRAARTFLDLGELTPSLEDDLDAHFDSQGAALRRADRAYWRGIIDELRALRAKGALMQEGQPV